MTPEPQIEPLRTAELDEMEAYAEEARDGGYSEVSMIRPEQVLRLIAAARSQLPAGAAGLREAALEVLRATDALRDARNGLGHPGEPHDSAIHIDPCTDLPGVAHVYDLTGDCAACGGSQYGTEDDLQRAVVRLRLVLGEPLQQWEEVNHGDSVRAALAEPNR